MQADFPAGVKGSIALIKRGTCEFGLKSALAGSAGAVGAVIYNNVPGPVQATLGAPPRPEGEYVASVGVSLETGTAWVEAITGGATLTASLDVATEVKNSSTYNVLATTKCGDQNNKLMLGAHTDSVLLGPGINDDGSGTVGVLEVAKALSKYKVNNAVSFGFWSGEEIGLLGSTFYVNSLAADEQAKIKAYLNFDMVSILFFFFFESIAVLTNRSRSPRQTTSTQSTTVMAAPSTKAVLLEVPRLRSFSRGFSSRLARITRPRLLTGDPITDPSSKLVSLLGAHSPVLTELRRKKRWRCLAELLARRWISAITRPATTMTTWPGMLLSCTQRPLLRLSQSTRCRGAVCLTDLLVTAPQRGALRKLATQAFTTTMDVDASDI